MNTMNIGELVNVQPSNQAAHGRGIGTVTRVGSTLVLVKFPHIAGGGPGGAIACLKKDCSAVSEPIRATCRHCGEESDFSREDLFDRDDYRSTDSTIECCLSGRLA